jgi:4a-hydroxytetrahydrobiopterin dehydratase
MLSPSEFLADDGVRDWRLVSDGAVARYRTETLEDGTRFGAAIAALPGAEEQALWIDVRRDAVTVRLLTITESDASLSRADLDLARRISTAAQAAGLAADPSGIQSILLVPGAPDIAAIQPFWQAVLGYEPRLDSPAEDLVDPRERGPAFWLEEMDAPRADGLGAIHVAVWVAPEIAQARIAAALAAGGRMVRDRGPSWWTLADAAGNEADISTIAGRG